MSVYQEVGKNSNKCNLTGLSLLRINNILCRKANWIGHILRRNCLLRDAIEGRQMTELKEVGKRRTQLLNDLGNRRRHWELKEEAENRKRQ